MGIFEYEFVFFFFIFFLISIDFLFILIFLGYSTVKYILFVPMFNFFVNALFFQFLLIYFLIISNIMLLVELESSGQYVHHDMAVFGPITNYGKSNGKHTHRA
jgi:hypothetical protein